MAHTPGFQQISLNLHFVFLFLILNIKKKGTIKVNEQREFPTFRNFKKGINEKKCLNFSDAWVSRRPLKPFPYLARMKVFSDFWFGWCKCIDSTRSKVISDHIF